MKGEILTEKEYDDQLDHLVDVRNLSYDEARDVLGPPPYELLTVREPTEVVALLALMRSARQLIINKRGAAKVRTALRKGHSAAA